MNTFYLILDATTGAELCKTDVWRVALIAARGITAELGYATEVLDLDGEVAYTAHPEAVTR